MPLCSQGWGGGGRGLENPPTQPPPDRVAQDRKPLAGWRHRQRPLIGRRRRRHLSRVGACGGGMTRRRRRAAVAPLPSSAVARTSRRAPAGWRRWGCAPPRGCRTVFFVFSFGPGGTGAAACQGPLVARARRGGPTEALTWSPDRRTGGAAAAAGATGDPHLGRSWWGRRGAPSRPAVQSTVSSGGGARATAPAVKKSGACPSPAGHWGCQQAALPRPTLPPRAPASTLEQSGAVRARPGVVTGLALLRRRLKAGAKHSWEYWLGGAD